MQWIRRIMEKKRAEEWEEKGETRSTEEKAKNNVVAGEGEIRDEGDNIHQKLKTNPFTDSCLLLYESEHSLSHAPN